MREISTGHHLIEATINGRTGEFVLDTGANMTVVEPSNLGVFGIAPGSGGIGGAVGVGGGGRASRASIDSFRVGPVEIRQNRIVSADLGQLLQTLGRVTGAKVYGIIGQDVLKEHRAIIDVERPMLYLMEADRDPAPVPAERCRALITVPLVEGWPKTYEDEAIANGASDALRVLHFGQGDHIRYYGADLRDRIAAAGFKLSKFTATPEQTIRNGLIAGESVFIASKER